MQRLQVRKHPLSLDQVVRRLRHDGLLNTRLCQLSLLDRVVDFDYLLLKFLEQLLDVLIDSSLIGRRCRVTCGSAGPNGRLRPIRVIVTALVRSPTRRQTK